MNTLDCVLLHPDEALEAVCIDFDQYGFQAEEFRAIAENLNFSGKVPEDEPAGGVLRSLFTLHPPDAETLARICSAVFWTRATVDFHDDGSPMICIPTELKQFKCTRCGKCCRTLDFSNQCTREDVVLWEKAGRQDILEWVEIGENDEFRIWVRPGIDLLAEVCPWLVEEAGGFWACSIHDYKPEICRDYPGSLKHAMRTGCPVAC